MGDETKWRKRYGHETLYRYSILLNATTSFKYSLTINAAVAAVSFLVAFSHFSLTPNRGISREIISSRDCIVKRARSVQFSDTALDRPCERTKLDCIVNN